MSASTSRSKLLERAAVPSSQKARFFESPLYQNLVAEFVRELSITLTKRLGRKAELLPAGDVIETWDESCLVLLFRVYQSNIEVAVPFECLNDILSGLFGNGLNVEFGSLSEADQETLRQFVIRLLAEEELFLKHRVLLRGMSVWSREDRAERLKTSEEIFIGFRAGSVTYLMSAFCDYTLMSRLRTYARLASRRVLETLPVRVTYKLRARSALNSYQLLLSVKPGERIPVSQLFRESFDLVQEGSHPSLHAITLSSEVKFLKAEEAA